VPQTILVIDDDPNELGLVQRILVSAYQVVTASTAAEGMRLLDERRPDLVLLDVTMPDQTGWDVCSHIRARSRVPIIFVSARQTQEDLVKGLDLGADDYVVKPFHASELRARVRAVLRRAAMPAEISQTILRYGEDALVINTDTRAVSVCGRKVQLTPTEYRLLVFLLGHAGRVLTTEQIFVAVWSGETDALQSNVKWYIWRLRQKFERTPSQPRFILTVAGAGYRFSD
jgi:two-component system KDP operon response regulator KdpE